MSQAPGCSVLLMNPPNCEYDLPGLGFCEFLEMGGAASCLWPDLLPAAGLLAGGAGGPAFPGGG